MPRPWGLQELLLGRGHNTPFSEQDGPRPGSRWVPRSLDGPTGPPSEHQGLLQTPAFSLQASPAPIQAYSCVQIPKYRRTQTSLQTLPLPQPASHPLSQRSQRRHIHIICSPPRGRCTTELLPTLLTSSQLPHRPRSWLPRPGWPQRPLHTPTAAQPVILKHRLDSVLPRVISLVE